MASSRSGGGGGGGGGSHMGVSGSMGTGPKLFVGQLPKTMTDGEVRAILERYGHIVDFILLTQPGTGMSKGSGFVTYSTAAEAHSAIDALNGKLTLPGMRMPMNVKFADSHLQAVTASRLFVGMIPHQLTESDLRPLFEQFGSVVDFVILRHKDSGLSKGSGFVRYARDDEAQSAIRGLNGTKTLPGATAPLVVKPADSDRDKADRKAPAAMAPGAMNPAAISPAQLLMALPALMSSLGPWSQMMAGGAAAPFMSGAASGDAAAAASALAASMPYALSAMPAMPPMSAMPFPAFGAMAAMAGGAGGQTGSGGGASNSAAMSAAMAAASGLQSGPAGVGVAPSRHGPSDANLFVYNIPQEFSDFDLYSLFQGFGTVYSAKVFVEKATGVGRGFGFVSFAESSSAKNAIEVMNGYMINGRRLKVQIKTDGPGPRR